MRTVVKKSVIVYGIFGLLIGFGMFIYSINSNEFTFSIGSNAVKGYKGGLISILFMPVIMALVGAGHGVMLWFPIAYIYRKLKNKSKSFKEI
ncbi:hypothetical protein [Paenibacillus lupini]|uniref:hypothetical protein n=1 Tax=Paenibacillus lupini TaxID=1450204 RepID=UPI00141F1844|nr:hypothetical protein [Paenibacillus lupini]NIK25254.1 hypothetical protein [Paenibacillus lupini]